MLDSTQPSSSSRTSTRPILGVREQDLAVVQVAQVAHVFGREHVAGRLPELARAAALGHEVAAPIARARRTVARIEAAISGGGLVGIVGVEIVQPQEDRSLLGRASEPGERPVRHLVRRARREAVMVDRVGGLDVEVIEAPLVVPAAGLGEMLLADDGGGPVARIAKALGQGRGRRVALQSPGEELAHRGNRAGRGSPWRSRTRCRRKRRRRDAGWCRARSRRAPRDRPAAYRSRSGRPRAARPTPALRHMRKSGSRAAPAREASSISAPTCGRSRGGDRTRARP